jgi:hypothetical protein
VLGYYACADAEWDVVNLMEASDEQGVAGVTKSTTNLTVTGAFSRIRVIPLVTPEAYDTADVQAATEAYRAPGQS